jgi:imidazolonepropionase-like amidohydrolase
LKDATFTREEYLMPEKQRVSPDTIFSNGQIISMNPLDPSAMLEAVAVKGERIVACGSKKEVLALAGDETKIIDLHGKTMLPGFIDGHGHFPWAGNDQLYGVSLFSPPIGKVRNTDGGCSLEQPRPLMKDCFYRPSHGTDYYIDI